MNMQGVWIASLSDGSTVYESPPVTGEKTPWRQLMERCEADDELSITMMRLQFGNVTISAMPHKMCNGYFHAKEVHRIVWRNKYIHLTGVGSVVGDKVFITWAEITGDGQLFTKMEVRPLETCKVHTSLTLGESHESGDHRGQA